MKKSLKNLYHKMSIKTKWIIFVIFLVLYPMILIGYVGYKNYEEVIMKHFIQTVQNDVTTATEYLKERIEGLEEFLTEVQYDANLFKINTYYNKTMKGMRLTPEMIKNDQANSELFNKALMNDYELNQEIEKFLNSILLSRKDIDMAAYQFTEQEEMGYIMSSNRARSYYQKQDFLEKKIFDKIEEALKAENKTVYYVDSEGRIYIGQKIYFREDFRYCGKIIFRIDSEYLFKHYKNILEDAIQAVYVVDNHENELLAVGDLTHKRRGRMENFIQEEPQIGIVYKQEVAGEAMIYNTFESQNLNLASAVYISTDILLSEIRAMSRFMFMLCISILPIFILIANKLYKEIIYPVYVLSEKMQQIEKGDIGIEISTKRTDEIGYVYSAFNKMSRRINYLVNYVYKEQLALKNAELKALQMQINPHFLYNTLEMINWKARLYGADEVSEMIEALGGIMEVNIDRREMPFLTIKEEIVYLKNYVFLLQKRYGDRITFDIKSEPELMDYKIPRLLLQPLVENALTHGVEQVGTGIVQVSMKVEDEYMFIIVEDNGVGIPANRLKMIQGQLLDQEKGSMEDEETGRGHIGVINVQKRIQLLYGKNYGLSIKSEENKGTQVILRLPKNNHEK